MVEQHVTCRNASQGFMGWLQEFRIAWTGLGLLLLMGFLAIGLALLLDPELTLKEAVFPNTSHIAIMRVFGMLTALGFLAYVQIIHIRQTRTERQLAQAEQRYRDLFMLSPDPLVILDDETQILMANHQAAVLGGFSSEQDLIGRRGLDLVDFGDRTRLQERLDGALAGERVDGFHARLLRQDGGKVEVELNAARIQEPQAGKSCVVCVCRDVTERKKLEETILEISERERLRVGLDLHDGVCSELAGIAYLAQGLHDRLKEKDPAAAKDSAEIWELLKDSIDQARSLARGLAPASVMNGGLCQSLGELCQIAESRSGVECLFVCEDDLLMGDSSSALHVYRIVQESVNNALSHAHPTSIRVELSKTADRIKLKVSDDGVGFRDSRSKEGMGIAIMRYRCNLLRGTFAVEPDRDKGGTSVVCSFPDGDSSN